MNFRPRDLAGCTLGMDALSTQLPERGKKNHATPIYSRMGYRRSRLLPDEKIRDPDLARCSDQIAF